MIGLLLAVHFKPVPITDPSWTVGDDYPPAVLRREEDGATGYRLCVSNDGIPPECAIERSGGFAHFNECAYATAIQPTRFKPAVDRHAATVKSSDVGKVTCKVPWQVAKITAAPESN
jgi:hypothetical protein